MLTLPKLIDRPAETYLAVKATTTMADMPNSLPKAIGEISTWLGRNGVTPTGPLFFRYNLIDMAALLELEIGFPVSPGTAGDERVVSGTLPAGRFASILHQGPYDELYDVNAVLIGWAKERGIRWDMTETEKGDRFGCRLEIYHTDPTEQPDSSQWQTEVAIRLADAPA